MIRCVSFDADGTVLDFEGTMRASLAQSLAEIRAAVPGAAANALTVERLIAIRGEVAAELRGRVLAMEEIRLLAFERTLMEIGALDPALAAHLTDSYLQRRFGQVRLYPDAVPVLDALAAVGYRLGLATNGNSYPERCGLAGRFDFVVLAQDVGFEKPDARFYRAVIAAAGVPPGQIAHVGDSPVNDVQGARAAGLRTVWLDRDRARDAAVRADVSISSLAELPDALAALSL
ncbi:MAG: HAD family hydrolase [Chloroflexota bacterium]|nr:HAD family hydrolase [Chloroflexota bacterium]